MPNWIACRIASYGNYAQRGWAHAAEIGLSHVEIKAPPPDEMEAVQRRLEMYRLGVSCVQVDCPIAEADVAERMASGFAACRTLDASFALVAARGGDLDRNVLWERFRRIGDAAAAHGVTVVIELHPDLATNGPIALETMKAIGHPHVRINYDTANVYFYNHDVDPRADLETIADYVAAVHLKDSRGLHRVFDFPPLGAGVVDFPMVFTTMESHSFGGPYTIELQGTEGVEFDEATTLRNMEQSVAYLRSIRAMP